MGVIQSKGIVWAETSTTVVASILIYIRNESKVAIESHRIPTNTRGYHPYKSRVHSNTRCFGWKETRVFGMGVIQSKGIVWAETSTTVVASILL
jgi:hypothetical protein